MEVKIKRLHPDSVIPSYALPGDAGMDLTAVSREIDDYGNVSYGTGLAFEIPEGYTGLIFPRSSICKKQLVLSNSVGVIDSGYRGEVTMKFKMTQPDSCGDNIYKVGDKIGQIIIVPYPYIKFSVVDSLSKTERNEGGYGHTGN